MDIQNGRVRLIYTCDRRRAPWIFHGDDQNKQLYTQITAYFMFSYNYYI